MKVGYARVSTTGQSLEVQLDALQSAGCEKVFKEKQSGKTADDREELNSALEYVREGDVLVCTKLDRLARSMSDLWAIITKLESKGVGLKVLDQPLIDTTTREGKLVVTMFGYVAETERSLILERTNEGRAKAKAKGVRFGRKQKLDESKLRLVIDDFRQGRLSAQDLAEKHGISRSTLYRHMATLEQDQSLQE